MDLLTLVKAQVEHRVRQAEETLGRKFRRPRVVLDIRDGAGLAGQCNHKQAILRFNQFYLRQELRDMIDDTIPHEVAHWIDWELNHKHGHGDTWRAIMLAVYGLKPTRCHSYQRAKKVRNLDDLL